MDGAVKMIGTELACRWTDNSDGMPSQLPATGLAPAAGSLPVGEWGRQDRA